MFYLKHVTAIINFIKLAVRNLFRSPLKYISSKSRVRYGFGINPSYFPCTINVGTEIFFSLSKVGSSSIPFTHLTTVYANSSKSFCLDHSNSFFNHPFPFAIPRIKIHRQIFLIPSSVVFLMKDFVITLLSQSPSPCSISSTPAGEARTSFSNRSGYFKENIIPICPPIE